MGVDDLPEFDVRALTVVLRDGELEVDHAGLSIYEAWAFLVWGSKLLRNQIEELDDQFGDDT